MRIFSCDFETTVDDDTKQQTSTEVWSAAIAELYSDFVTVYNNCLLYTSDAADEL